VVVECAMLNVCAVCCGGGVCVCHT